MQYYIYSQLRLNKAGGLKMYNEKHFSSAQRRYDNMMPDDSADYPDEQDCPECETEIELNSGDGICPKCGYEYVFDVDYDKDQF